MKFLKLALLACITVPTGSYSDSLNLNTGEYIMDLGGGDQMNLGTGDYIMNLE